MCEGEQLDYFWNSFSPSKHSRRSVLLNGYILSLCLYACQRTHASTQQSDVRKHCERARRRCVCSTRCNDFLQISRHDCVGPRLREDERGRPPCLLLCAADAVCVCVCVYRAASDVIADCVSDDLPPTGGWSTRMSVCFSQPEEIF